MFGIRVVLVGIVWFWGTSLSLAHEMKVLANHFVLNPKQERVTVYLSWGHVLPVDELVEESTLARYELISPGGEVVSLEKKGVSLQANEVDVTEPGVHQVVVDRKSSVLTYVIDAEGNRRMKFGPKTSIKEGRIDYGFRSQQFAKALLVKEPTKATKISPIGQALEIVPVTPPEAWKQGKSLQFQILYKGNPLDREQMLASYVGFRPTNAWCYATVSNHQGIVEVVPQQAGSWVFLVRVRKEAPADVRNQYDYETYTATLALEVRP